MQTDTARLQLRQRLHAHVDSRLDAARRYIKPRTSTVKALAQLIDAVACLTAEVERLEVLLQDAHVTEMQPAQPTAAVVA